MDSPSNAHPYEEGRRLALADKERLGARSRWLGNLRGVSFAAFVIGTATWVFGSSSTGGVVGALGLIAFIVLVVLHGPVVEAEEHAERLALVNEHALARSRGEFADLPATGEAPVGHAYAGDLDLFGRGSLYQRLSVAHTHFGKDTLTSWLARFASLDEIAARQSAVRELAAALDFRREFEASSLALSQKRRQGRIEVASSPDPEPLLAWIEEPAQILGRTWLVVVSFLLPLVTLSGIALHVAGRGNALCWTAPLLVQLALLASTARATTRAFNAVSFTEGAFLRYGRLLELIETFPGHSEWLLHRQARLSESAAPGNASSRQASRSMRRFRSLVGWFDLRHNGMVYPFIDALLLWDIHSTLRLERWKRDVGGRARDWFRVIGELEALSSLAGFAFDEPDASWPEIRDGAQLSATALGHPLLPRDRRTTNDVAAFGPGQALLVTGSNMSGKSTFLRALGTNVVLAFSGAPVVARDFVVPPCELGTSIRVSDSLLTGTSHFYAEVKKLAHVVHASRDGRRIFFLLDEVLHGTNSRERQIGARWVLADLLEHGAFGVVTTHDEGLCQLPEPLMPRVRQHHFRESVEAGEMTFDYLLRPGPVTSGNALRLMQKVGLEVPLS